MVGDSTCVRSHFVSSISALHCIVPCCLLAAIPGALVRLEDVRRRSETEPLPLGKVPSPFYGIDWQHCTLRSFVTRPKQSQCLPSRIVRLTPSGRSRATHSSPFGHTSWPVNFRKPLTVRIIPREGRLRDGACCAIVGAA